MGGWGSGRYSGPSATITDQVNRVDIRFVRKQGWLYDGRFGLLSWNCRGETTGTVAYRISGNTFSLDYKVRETGGEWELVKLPVALTSIPCRYGGRRYYFLCPNQGCGRRCELLYSVGKYFVCRKCTGYIFATQTGGTLNRLIEKKHKLGRRIFEYYDGDGWMKKKGMHWRTFDKLSRQYWALDEMLERELIALL